MANAFAKAGTFIAGLDVVEEKMASMVDTASMLTHYMSAPDSNESKVNHRPAAQQWVV